jgi:Reverse transcriptase (RNA-dependent DNA polymerase)
MYGLNLSDVVQLVCSVLQGSILGPLLFFLYTAELEDVAAGMGVSIHMYADDTQLYVHCKPSGMIDAVARLEQCINRVDKWMAACRLKLNSDKSEVIWVGLARTLQKHPSPEVTVGISVIQASDKVQLLGVGISADLTFDRHVMKIAGQCFYQLCQLRSVRQLLDTDSIKTLTGAFVSSRVDYCCSLLAGSPRSVTDKLQRVLNAAARMVTNTGKFERGLT